MRKLLAVLAFVFLSIGVYAQNLTTVSASNITDLNGTKLAVGQLCFTATDNSDTPISFQIGGGGQALKRGYCSSVTAGVVTSFTVPNPAATLPTGIYYRVTVKDSSTGAEVLRYPLVSFTGATFNFDAYAPTATFPGAPLSGNIVTGNLGVTGNLNVTGTCTGCGGGGTVPTGTGFTHITAGVQDGTAKTVDVSSADITGVLKAASFPALTGDVTTSAGALATTIANNAVTQAKVTNGYVDLSSTQASIAGAKTFTTSVSTPKLNGAVYCDGTTNASFNAAVTAAGSTGTVIITNGSVCPVTGNVTVGSGVTTIFQTGTPVAIPTATTVTFNGPLIAPPVNIFSFTGTAALVVNGPTRELYPEWWGAKGDNSTDDTIPVNNALANANSVDGQRILLSAGKTYVSASTISLLQFTSVRMGGSSGVATFNGTSPILKFTGNPAAARYIDARSTQAIELDHMIIQYTNTSFAGRVIDLQHSIASDSQNFYIHDLTVMGTSTAKLAICGVCADNTDMGVVERTSFFWMVHAVEALNANIFTLRNSNFGSGNVGVGDIGGDYITDLGNNSWIGPANNFEMSTNNKAINCSTCGNNITIIGNTFNDFVAGYNATLISINSSSINVQDNHVAVGPGSTAIFFSGAGAVGTFNLTGNTLGNWGTAFIGLNGPAKSANINSNSYGTLTNFTNICCPSSGTIQDNNGATRTYGLNISPNNTARLIADFTDANTAGLQVITGLSIAIPATPAGIPATAVSFHCSIAYSQATPVSGDQFGVASLTTAPTNLKAQAHVITTEGAAAAQTTGNSGNITTTTPTSIVTFTPVGTGEKQADIDGSLETSGSGASTLQFYVTNGTAANVIVIKKESYCRIF